eukprot:CAMPEP_0182865634 /NCGR_PEP_ID=MMETSP0034_2-20130328/7793_1 /TAXON_ID=156128 /ORGANISM="Nephroselmis pyriformis, Strain CCMP717" /LENGTH=245 /DNA_ID=CAMNT_0024997943 /DNA_START=12 /DNA_END=749 /DNA_ORIENTATION=-
MAAINARVFSGASTSVACSRASRTAPRGAAGVTASPAASVGVKAVFGNTAGFARRATVSASTKTGVVAAAAGLEELVAGIEALGPDVMNDTYYPKAKDQENVTKPWVIIDAKDQTLGRLATLAAIKLRGKDKATYHPSMDTGSYVIVINAEHVKVSGNKASQKIYRTIGQNGRPGSMKTENFSSLQARIPQRIIERAVKGMLPKNRLGRTLFTHLKVYKGSEHPHEAQQAEDITAHIDAKPKMTA